MGFRKLKEAPIVREPRENISRAQMIVGLAGRAFVLFLCVLGSSLFIGDAMGVISPASARIPSASTFSVVVSSLLFSAAAAAASYDRRTLVAVPVASAASFFGILAISGNPVTLLSDGVRYTWDTAITRLGQDYISFTSYRMGGAYHYDEVTLLNVGTAVLAAILTVIFALCLIRRARVTPTAIVCAAILVPIFTYNLTRYSAGIAFAIVFIAAALSLCMFDRRYGGREFAFFGRREKRKAKKAARKAKRAAKREKRALLRRRAQKAYERALAVTDDRSLAKQAKRTVGKLERRAKAEEKKLQKEAAAEKKKADRRAKKEAKALAAKEKKRAAAERKRLAAAAKKDRALADRLASEKKKRLAASAAAKKQKKDEKRAARREKNNVRLSNAAGGGIAGILAAALAFICVAIPALAIKGKFPIIPFINEPVSVAREYVTAYLKGDDVDLNNLDIYGELSGMVPRKLSFDPLEYDGIQIFVVTGDLDRNVYLKSWMARDFDETEQQWMGATRDEVLEYREDFSKGFSPDEIRTEFNAIVNPTSVKLVDRYMNFQKQGFAVERVNMRRVNFPSKLLFIPAAMNTEYGVLDYGTLDKTGVKYSHFYDGIYSSRFFENDCRLSTVSFISDLHDPNVADGIEDQRRYFELAMSYLGDVEAVRENISFGKPYGDGMVELSVGSRVYHVSEDDLSDIDEQFKDQLKAEDVGYTGESLVKRALDDPELYERMKAYAATEEDYRRYAYNTYTNTFGGEDVAALADSLLADAGYYKVSGRDGAGFVDSAGREVPAHKVIMTVIDYLRDGYEYTLTPTVPENSARSVLEAFLFDTKEGYCSHFATAACALLRYFGYPVRFCEGYIATDFETNYVEDVNAKYITMVHDENAHAWIEVYLDGIGWQQYETTPKYAEPMYDANYVVEPSDYDPTFAPAAPAGDQPEEPEVEQIEPEPDELLYEKDTTDYALIFIIIGASAAGIAVIALAARLMWKHLKKKAEKAAAKRHEPVERALSDARMSGEDNRALALELNDQIMSAFSVAGFEPEDGEGVAEFSARLAEVFEGLSEQPTDEVVRAMMRAEFGTSLERSDLIVIGDFLNRLVPSVYSGLPRLKRFWWRYIKRKI